MTPETILKLETAFLIGCSDIEACLAAEITKTTLYAYQDRHPEFAERKETLKKNPTLVARRSVLSAMPDDGDLSLKYLERKESQEFRTKTESLLTGDAEKPVQITVTDRQILEQFLTQKADK